MKYTLMSMLLLGSLLQAQDYQLDTSSQSTLRGYAYEDYPFPSGLKLRTLDKQTVEFKPEGVTLIQVWTKGGGSQVDLWTTVTRLAERYEEQGLTTISVNFENGTSGKVQRAFLDEYFTKVTKPKHFYYDTLGYVVDLLKVPGFPTYYLVDKQGRVVFRTNGNDPEGVQILENEIIAKLQKG